MSYYDINRDVRLEYQREYQTLYREEYLDYQKWYYQNVLKDKRKNVVVKKKVIKKEKKTKLTKGFLNELKKVCRNKIRDYNDTIEAEEEARELSNNNKAFEGFDIINGMFRLKF